MSTIVRQVGHTGITVADLERSLEFWHGALGFELLFRARATGTFAETVSGVPGASIEIAMLRGGGVQIELVHYRKPDDGQVIRPRPNDVGSWHLAFMVDDIDGFLDGLKVHGFEPVHGVACIEDGPRAGGKAAYARDPDGTMVELIQPPAGAEPPCAS